MPADLTATDLDRLEASLPQLEAEGYLDAEARWTITNLIVAAREHDTLRARVTELEKEAEDYRGFLAVYQESEAQAVALAKALRADNERLRAILAPVLKQVPGAVADDAKLRITVPRMYGGRQSGDFVLSVDGISVGDLRAALAALPDPLAEKEEG